MRPKRKRPTDVPEALGNVQDQLEKLAFLPIGQCVREIGRFDGDGSIQEFIIKFNHALNAYGLDAADAYRILPLLLDGKALRCYERIDLQKFNTWEPLIKELGRLLNDEVSKQKALAGLQANKKPAESLGDFARRVRNTINKAYAEQTEDVRKAVAKNAFLQGLPAELKSRLLTNSKATSIEQLLEDAELHEMAIAINEENEKKIFAMDDLTKAINAVVNGPNGKPKTKNFSPNRNYYTPSYNYRGNQGFYRGNYQSTPYRGRVLAQNFSRPPWNSRPPYGNGYYRPRSSQFRGRFTNSRFQGPQRGNQGYNRWTPRRPPYQLNFLDEEEAHGEDYSQGNDHQEYPEEYDDSKPTSSRSSSRFFSTINTVMSITMLFALLLTPSMAAPSSPKEFLYCQQALPSILLSITKNPSECQPINTNRHLTLVGNMYLAPRTKPVSAIRCRRIVTHVCMSAFMKIFKPSMQIIRQEILHVEPTLCQQLNETHIYEEKEMFSSNLGVWRTTTHQLPTTPFFGSKCGSTETLVIDKGTISTIADNMTLLSSFGSLDQCSISEGSCILPNATIIWNKPKTPPCPISIGAHKMMISSEAILVEELQTILFPASGSIPSFHRYCLPTPAIAMENGIFVQFPQFQHARQLSDVFELAQRRGQFRLVRDTHRISNIFHFIPRQPPLKEELLAGETKFSYNPLENKNILHRLRQLEMPWVNIIWQKAHHRDLSDLDAILRAIRLKEVQEATRPILNQINNQELRTLMEQETDVNTMEALLMTTRYLHAMPELRNMSKDERTDYGYRLVAEAALQENTFLFDRGLDQEFGITIPRAPRDAQPYITEYANSLFGKDLYSLSIHQYDRKRRDTEMRYDHLVTPAALLQSTATPSIPYWRTPTTPSPPLQSSPTTTRTSTTTTHTTTTTTIPPNTTTSSASSTTTSSSTTSTTPTPATSSTTSKPPRSTTVITTTTTPTPSTVTTTTTPSTTTTTTTTTSPTTTTTTFTSTTTTPTTTTSTMSTTTSSSSSPFKLLLQKAIPLFQPPHAPLTMVQKVLVKEVAKEMAAQKVATREKPATSREFPVGKYQLTGRHDYETINFEDSSTHDEYKRSNQPYVNDYTIPTTLPPSISTMLPVIYNNDSFAQKHRQICSMLNLRLDYFRTTININPTTGIRQLFQRHDLIAQRLSNDVLAVAQCWTIATTEIVWDHRINNTCYEDLPVMAENSTLFVIPGTRQLKLQSKPINCGQAETGRKLPDEADLFNTRHAPLEISKLSIVRRRDTSNTTTSSNPIAAFFIGIKTSTVNALNDAGSTISGAATITAQKASTIANTVKKEVTTTFEKIKSNMTMITWIAVAIGTTLLTIPACIFASKCYVASKATKAASTALLGTALNLRSSGLKNFKRQKNLTKKQTALLNAILVSGTNSEEEEDEIEMREIQNDRIDRKYRMARAQMITFVPLLCLVAPVCTTGSNLPFIYVTIQGQQVPALLDSGASISYMRINTLEQLGIRDVNYPTTTSARTANGSSVQFIAKVRLEVNIGRERISHDFLISDNHHCPAPILMGIDFIRSVNKMGKPVSFGEGTIIIGNERLTEVREQVYTINNPEPTYDVAILEEMTLDPRTDNVIMAYIKDKGSGKPHRFTQNGDLLVGPREETSEETDEESKIKKTLLIGRSVTTPGHSGQVLVRVFNPTKEPVALQRDELIATAERLPTTNQTGLVYSVFPPKYRKPYVPPEARWEERLPRLPDPSATADPSIGDKLELANPTLTPEDKLRIRRVISKHYKAFVGPDGGIGCYTGPVRHRIDLLENAEIPTTRPYRVPLEKREEIEKQIKMLLDQGIIRQSNSLFSAPIILVRKADKKSWRFAIDYRRLNNVTRKAAYLLPHITDILDLTAGKTLYSTFDFQSGFFQIPMQEDHIERTAFGSFLGTFEFLRMPMGLSGAPSTFQRVMEDLKRQIQASIFIYIDDVILASDNVDSHIRDLDEVLAKIVEFGLKIRLDKCQIAKPSVKFLGYVVSAKGLAPNPEKVRAIEHYPRPTTATEMKSFLGAVSFFRRFIAGYAAIAGPLHKATTEEGKIKWTEERQRSFDRLRTALITAPILAAPRLGFPFTIETDASATAVAAVLLQADNEGLLHPIAFESRKLKDEETRYTAIELEALGLVFALGKFKPYITGAMTTVVTDHAPLTALLRRKTTGGNGRLEKYQVIIQEYDVIIKYRPGRKNQLCDALSRFPPKEETREIEQTEMNDSEERNEETKHTAYSIGNDTITTAAIEEDQSRSKWIKDIIETIQSGRTSDSAAENLIEKNNYFIDNGILYRTTREGRPVIIINEQGNLKEKIMSYLHNDRLAGAHLGIDKTISKVQARFVWRKMNRDIAIFIRTCKECQLRKIISHDVKREELGVYPTPSKPFERIHIDILGPLPQTMNGNRYILVTVDSFSKYVIASPLQDQKAETCAKKLVRDVIAIHGVAGQIVSDRGTNFLSEIYAKTCMLLGIHHTPITAYHKNGNGQVERWNRTVEEMISHYVNKKATDWDTHLHLVTFAYNTSTHATTGYTPFFLIHGREASLPLDISLPRRSYAEEKEYPTQLLEDLYAARLTVMEKIKNNSKEQKQRYDLPGTVERKEFEPGWKVLVRNETAGKLEPQYNGPFTIKEIIRPNVILDTPRGNETIHMDRIKLFRTTTIS